MTSTAYTFTQQVDDTIMLTTTLNQAGISVPLLFVNTNGVGSEMIVTVVYADALPVNDLSLLNNSMAMYTNISPQVLANMIASITVALQNPSNAVTLLTTKILMLLPTLSYQQLKQIMTVLGLQ